MTEGLQLDLERSKLLIEELRTEIKRLRVEVNRATLIATSAIWERAQETDMRVMATGLITMYHKNAEHAAEDWRGCMNERCVSARLLIEHAQKQEVEVTNFGLALMQTFALKFSLNRDSDGNVDHIKAWLIKRSELPQDAPQNQGRIVLQ